MTFQVKKLSIFWRFTILAIIVFILIGFFLTGLIEPALIDFVFEQQKLNSVVFANRLAAEHLLAEDFENTATADSRKRFDLFIQNLQVNGLFRVTFWNPKGLIVYSDNEKLISKEMPLSEGLKKALTRETVVKLHKYDPNDPGDTDAYEKPYGEALEIYSPLTFGASSEVKGVVEVYSRIGYLRQQIEMVKNILTRRVTLSLLFMFAVLSYIVWGASRTVERQGAELQEYAISLEEKIKERTKTLEETSRREVAQAKELVKLKDQFIFVAAHELRSPAASIKWSLDALTITNPDLYKKEKGLFDVLYQCNERLLALVGDILGAARIEGKALKLNLTGVSLRGVVDSTVKKLETFAAKNQVVIRIDFPRNLPYVFADQLRLEEVLINLITNAIKYNKKGGEVKILAEGKGSEIIVKVSDTGLGIRTEDYKRVFDKFWRAEEVHNIEGTGLGLFIVKNLVELMSGRIWFESEAGKGTTFSITLPVADVFLEKKAPPSQSLDS